MNMVAQAPTVLMENATHLIMIGKRPVTVRVTYVTALYPWLIMNNRNNVTAVKSGLDPTLPSFHSLVQFL